MGVSIAGESDISRSQPRQVTLALGYNRDKVSPVLQHILAQQTVYRPAT